jgi:hypothetical protein
MSRPMVKFSGLALIIIFVAAQFFQPDKANPPAVAAADFEAVAKPHPEVATIVKRACRDCHSNNTTWPWYSKISPVSWAVAGHVKEGRARLNFSEWNLLGPEMSRLRLKEACAEIKSGGMPLWEYRLIHSEARLTNADIEAFCAATNSVASP